MGYEKGTDYSWGRGTWRGESKERGNLHLPYEIKGQFQTLINQEVGRQACFVFYR